MKDHIRVLRGLIQRVLRQIQPQNVDAFLGQNARISLFQRRRVIIGEAIQPSDQVPICRQPFCQMRSNKPGRAGDEYSHVL